MSTSMNISETGQLVCTRFFAGAGRGMKIDMRVTREEFLSMAHLPAETENDEFGTFQELLTKWTEAGAQTVWKTAEDWEIEAKELRTHRFGIFHSLADVAQAKADRLKETGQVE